MNKHPCYTVFLSTRTPQEALKCLYTHPIGCGCGYLCENSFISASRRVFWATWYSGTPKPGLSMGYTRAQNVLELKKEVETNNIQSSICRGYPQVPAGGI